MIMLESQPSHSNSLSSANDRGQIFIIQFNVVALCISELPPGWERIEDPVYGVYYVE